MARRFLNGIDGGASRIINIADGSANTDAVTLQQMNAFVRGLSWKASVRAASTGNITLTGPGTSIDGVALVSGDRVLLKNQTTGSENGIYVWTSGTAALTRTADANSTTTLEGATSTATEGTANHDTVWTQTADAITVGTTALVFAQLGGGSTPYAAGNGLSLTGSTFAVLAGTGIIADATSTRVDPSVVPRKFAAATAAATSTAFAHNFGTRDVAVNVYDTVTYEEVQPDVVRMDVNTVTLTFAVAPAAGAFRVVIIG